MINKSGMIAVISFGVIVICSVLLYFISNRFAEASSMVGDYFKLSRSVKGATFDAIAGSLPELLVALFAVVFFGSFEIGIGTIAGSALFNLLVIPGICVLVAPVAFKVSRDVINRDGLFYIISVFTLLVLILYFKVWGVVISLILLAAYFIYIREIVVDTKRVRKKVQGAKCEVRKNVREINIWRESWIGILAMIGIGGVTYFLVEYSIKFAEALNISPIIIAFTVIAAATSIPDTIISVANAKKGNIDDATSNVFGSNIFDIFVGLGLPLLIYSLIVGPVNIVFEQLEIVLGLLGATILTLFYFARGDYFSKRQGWVLLILYLGFVAYVVFLSNGV